jgi:hypothetical protein
VNDWFEFSTTISKFRLVGVFPPLYHLATGLGVMRGSSQQTFCVIPGVAATAKVKTTTLTCSPALGVDGLMEICIKSAAKTGVDMATTNVKATAAPRQATDTTRDIPITGKYTARLRKVPPRRYFIGRDGPPPDRSRSVPLKGSEGLERTFA